MLRALKFFGLLIVNFVVALIGTAIVETAIGKAFPSHSLSAVLWKEWILSITCGAFIGFWMWHTWHGDAAKWTWVLPAVWFGFKVLLAIGGGTVWFQFSGIGCASGIRSVECRNFFVFTIPFVRCVSYSLGAYVSSLVSGGRTAAASMMPPSTGP